MDEQTLYITDAPPEEVSQDFDKLFQEGVAIVQQLATGTWTDHNYHDPGITALEQICYAMTDLGYRLDYPIVDLLAGPTGSGAAYKSLPLPQHILSCQPVTLNDMRKIVIDVPGVKNAWVKPINSPTPGFFYNHEAQTLTFDPEDNEQIFISGLYTVSIEPEENLTGVGSYLIQQVKKQLNTSRNLGEDIAEVKVISPQLVGVKAELEVHEDKNPNELLSRIFSALGNHIAPPLRFYPYGEMKERGFSDEEIFRGPLLKHGFIDDKELNSTLPRQEIRASDLIRVLLDLPEVTLVKKLTLTMGTTEYPWVLKIDEGYIPRLSVDLCQIDLQMNGLPVRIDPDSVVESYAKKLRFDRPAQKSESERFPEPPVGTYRDPGHYYSIQNHFPDLYYTNELGVPDDVTTQEKGRIRQFKAYLLFFEQILANQFAQVAHFKDLLSFDKLPRHSYFVQALLDKVPHIEPILNPWLPLEGYQELDEDRLHCSIRNNQFKPSEAIILSGTDSLDGYYKVISASPDSIVLHLSEKEQAADEDKQATPSVKRTKEQVQQTLQTMADPPWRSIERMHTFYDHLLARFGETYSDFTRFFARSPEEYRILSRILLKQKQLFLKLYTNLSQTRNQAFDLSRTHEDSENISGLEKRLSLLMGLGEGKRPSVTDALAEVNTEVTEKWEFDQADFVQVLGLSVYRDYFRFNSIDRTIEILSKEKNSVLAKTKNPIDTEDIEEAVTSAWVKWWDWNLRLEGVHLVEHILLRPQAFDKEQGDIFLVLHKPITKMEPADDAQPLMLRCYSNNHGLEENELIYLESSLLTGSYLVESVEEDSFVIQTEEVVEKPQDIKDIRWRRAHYSKDPYSLQISIVLPKWPGRMQNPGFRQLLKTVIRNEAPAHLVVYTHWLDPEEMQEFEHYNAKWQEALYKETNGIST